LSRSGVLSDFMGATFSSLRQWSDRAQLLQDRVEVCHTPVLGDLAVDDAHCVDGLEADFGTCASDQRDEQALATLASLVGALVLARAVNDPKLSDNILRATKNWLDD
jgi:hypothetical protein